MALQKKAGDPIIGILHHYGYISVRRGRALQQREGACRGRMCGWMNQISETRGRGAGDAACHAEVLTWERGWSESAGGGPWRLGRSVEGSCEWSSHNRASRSHPMDTRIWTRPPAGWHRSHRSCRLQVHSGLSGMTAHSAHLDREEGWERRRKRRERRVNIVHDFKN